VKIGSMVYATPPDLCTVIKMEFPGRELQGKKKPLFAAKLRSGF